MIGEQSAIDIARSSARTIGINAKTHTLKGDELAFARGVSRVQGIAEGLRIAYGHLWYAPEHLRVEKLLEDEFIRAYDA